MSPEEIREAAKEMRLETIIQAARAYADLLENGQEVWYCAQAGGDPTKHQRIRESCFKNQNHPGRWCGRYLLVPVEEDA